MAGTDGPDHKGALARIVNEHNLPDAHAAIIEEKLAEIFETIHNPRARQDECDKLEEHLRSSQYLVDKAVGSGAFGSVYLGHSKQDGKKVAIKIIDLEETSDDIMTINREIMALTQGRICKQLVQYYGSQVFDTDLWIIMEYADGGSVLEMVQKHNGLAERYIAVIAREVLQGLQYLWSDNKVHRDIKAANVLLTKAGDVKLADFGASGQLTDTKKNLGTYVGSPYWMAPEMFMENKYDCKVDVWALGVTCIEMAEARPPHSDKSSMQVPTIVVSKPPPKLEGNFSPEFKNFVSVCLVKNARDRPHVDMLLRHPFIKKADKRPNMLAELFEEESGFDDADFALRDPDGQFQTARRVV